MYSTKILSMALANAGKKIQFKNDSALKSFIDGERILSEVVTPNGGMDIAGLKEIAFNNIKTKYTWYKLIQQYLVEYVSNMSAYVDEYLNVTESVKLEEYKINPFIKKLYDEGMIKVSTDNSSYVFNNDVNSELLNPEMSAEALYAITKHPLLEEGDIDFTDVQDIRYLIKAYLSSIPSNVDPESGYSELKQLITSRTMAGMNKVAVIMIIIDNLLNRPEDSWFANGVTGHVYNTVYKPTLEKLFNVIGSHLAVYLEEDLRNIESGRLIRSVIKDSSEQVIVFKDNYVKYLEEFGEIDGAVDAILALPYIEYNEYLEMSYSNFGSQIQSLANIYKDKMIIANQSARTKKYVNIATEFTEQYLKLIENMITASSELRELFLDHDNKDSFPTPEEIVNLAYEKIKDEDVIDPSVVKETCFAIIERVFNTIDPFLGTFVEGLGKTDFNGKRLESSSLVLSAMMRVYADMLINEMEIVELFEPKVDVQMFAE